MIKKLLKNQRGLTLIELLAVIVILGIIAAIAVPSIGNIIANTKEKAIVSEAIQIINAAKLAKVEEPGKVLFSKTELALYVDNVQATDYSVTYTKGDGYSILDHPATEIVKGEDVTTAKENDLIGFTQ